MPYCLNKVQGFCPVKIEITQFPDGFRLKTIPCSAAHTCCLGQIKESPSIPSTPPRPPPPPPLSRVWVPSWKPDTPLQHAFWSHFNAPFLCTFTCARLLLNVSHKLCHPVWWQSCLVPRPHYYAQPMRFGSCGPRKFSRPFISDLDTSPKCIDREGLKRCRTGTRQVAENSSLPQCMWDTLNLPKKLTY